MQRFERIYVEHVDAVRAYVRRRAPQPVVEDVVADVFVVALRRIDDVPRNALPWLYAVARKTLANERRKRHDLPLEHEPSYEPLSEPGPVGDSRLAAAFAALSDADREILRLVAWEGLPFRDVARSLDVSPVAARVRFHRAKARLAAQLDGAASFRPEPRGAMK
jgi:RNA polymerase sigma-70 factor (ECF subfamily)